MPDANHAAHDADIAPVAALFADSTRAAMLTALLDGRALAAGELARMAGVSAATASAHLSRLRTGGLVTVIAQGRHRYYRLAGAEVARVLESIALISPAVPVRSLRQSRSARLLAEARACYDHLAGRAGVRLLDGMLARGALSDHGGGFHVTRAGESLLAELGVDLAAVRRQRRMFAGSCLDWTERAPHLSGALGAALLARLLERGWLERGPLPRSIRVTDTGHAGFAQWLDAPSPAA